MKYIKDYKYKRVANWEGNREEPYVKLAMAIIQCAIKDFFAIKYGRKNESADCNLKEIESFFFSDFFWFFQKIDGPTIWYEINRAYKNGKDMKLNEIE